MPTTAVWAYMFNDPTWDNPTEIARFGNLKINQVFLSIDQTLINTNVPYTNKLVDFITQAKQANPPISVHAMILEQPNYINDGPAYAPATAAANGIIAYNAAHQVAAFDGIHIDTEPSQLPNWQNLDGLTGAALALAAATNELIMEEYAALLQKLHPILQGNGLEFSATTSWYFNYPAFGKKPPDPPLVPAAAAANLAPNLSYQVPLDFDSAVYDPTATDPGVGSTAADVIARAAHVVNDAAAMVGIGAYKFASQTDFATALNDLPNQANWALGAGGNFRGVSIFTYPFYITPWQPPPWQSPDIWVNNPGTPNPSHPIMGMNNLLYVRIRNAGHSKVANVPVRARYTPVGMGLPDDAFLDFATVRYTLPGIGALGGPITTIQLLWFLDPNENNSGLWPMAAGKYNHFCVQAIIDMVGKEYQGNSIAQTNFDLVTMSGSPHPIHLNFLVGNPHPHKAKATVNLRSLPKGFHAKLGKEAPAPFGRPFGLKPKQILPMNVRFTPPKELPSGKQPDSMLANIDLSIDGKVVGGFSMQFVKPGRPRRTNSKKPRRPGAKRKSV